MIDRTPLRADTPAPRPIQARPHRTRRRSTESTVPWPSPGPRQERLRTGRSPGSRVIATMHGLPRPRMVLRPAQWLPLPRFEEKRYASRSPLTVAGTASDSKVTLLTAFPIKSLSGHRRDLCPVLLKEPGKRPLAGNSAGHKHVCGTADYRCGFVTVLPRSAGHATDLTSSSSFNSARSCNASQGFTRYPPCLA